MVGGRSGSVDRMCPAYRLQLNNSKFIRGKQMSSISKRPNGHKWIQFTDKNKKRKTIRLGKCSLKDAQRISTHVDRLNFSQINNTTPDNDTANWICKVGDQLHEKLAAAGLAVARETTELGPFINNYIEGRSDVSDSTIGKYRNVEKRLLAHFGAGRNIGTITVGDALDYRNWVGTQVNSENTIRKDVQICKTIFNYAKNKELIRSNPFDGQPSNTLPKTDRLYFVTREQAKAVLDECPDNERKLLFALARFGGMRTPSEPSCLKWSDIDWDKKTIVVTAPKTERYGDGRRVMPLFPELLPYLQQAREDAEKDAVYVLPKLRRKGYNPATHMKRIVERACKTSWPKVFQNCRSTRQTELSQRFPSHVVASWLGNSTRIAEQFYLQVTEDHFQQALIPDVKPEAESSEQDGSTQKAKQQASAADGTSSQKHRENDESANEYVPLPINAIGQIPARGLEPPLPKGT